MIGLTLTKPTPIRGAFGEGISLVVGRYLERQEFATAPDTWTEVTFSTPIPETGLILDLQVWADSSGIRFFVGDAAPEIVAAGVFVDNVIDVAVYPGDRVFLRKFAP